MLDKKRSRLSDFLSKPIITGIGSIATLLFGFLSIYITFWGHPYREIFYYFDPIRTAILNAKNTSKLSFLYDDKKVFQDISAVNLVIWNNGELPVEIFDILSPVEFHTEPPSPIISATVLSKTREEIRLKCDNEKLAQGIVRLSWRILEKNDGGIIQITYFGSPNIKTNLAGVFKGQKRLKDFTKLKYPFMWPYLGILFVYWMLSFILLSMTFMRMVIRKATRNMPSIQRIRILKAKKQYRNMSVTIAIMTLITTLTYIFYFFNKPVPPLL